MYYRLLLLICSGKRDLVESEGEGERAKKTTQYANMTAKM